jgi:hypothetical protein
VFRTVAGRAALSGKGSAGPARALANVLGAGDCPRPRTMVSAPLNADRARPAWVARWSRRTRNIIEFHAAATGCVSGP